ncbi:MAG: hypothetical protein VKK04_10335 [Synechococcales bacterium]|nr:hypothetical protein [Synechococcales bacterium]
MALLNLGANLVGANSHLSLQWVLANHHSYCLNLGDRHQLVRSPLPPNPIIPLIWAIRINEVRCGEERRGAIAFSLIQLIQIVFSDQLLVLRQFPQLFLALVNLNFELNFS